MQAPCSIHYSHFFSCSPRKAPKQLSPTPCSA